MKPIFTAFSPNLEADDVALAARFLFRPWQWKQGPAIGAIESFFKAYAHTQSVYTCASGRTALYTLLKCLNLEPGDEVLLQAFTCVAVPDPIIWAGLKPVYVDCLEQTCNMSPADLEKKLTNRSRVLIIQHTFGRAADMTALMAVARRHHLIVIEDCAHALGAECQGKKLGTFGDAAFFSFGRDKIISSVFGGVAVIHDEAIAKKYARVYQSMPMPTHWWIKQQLLHPVISRLCQKTFTFLSLGKVILTMARKLRVIAPAVYPAEKRAGRPPFYQWRMPAALAALALHQLSKLKRFNQHRNATAAYYLEALNSLSLGLSALVGPGEVWLRFSMRVKDPKHFMRQAHQQDVYLGDWYDVPIAPKGVDNAAIGYRTGECPVAEQLARSLVNLPTSINVTRADADRIIGFIKKYYA